MNYFQNIIIDLFLYSSHCTIISKCWARVNIIPCRLAERRPAIIKHRCVEKGRSVATKPVIMRKLPSFFPILLFLVFYLHGTSGAHINNQFMPEKRMNSQGFFENSFNDGFGGFSTMKKRIPEQRYEVTCL